MEHFFNIFLVFIIAVVSQFYYFSNFFAPQQNLTDSETSSEIADPESFKDFDYYIEKFSNNL